MSNAYNCLLEALESLTFHICQDLLTCPGCLTESLKLPKLWKLSHLCFPRVTFLVEIAPKETLYTVWSRAASSIFWEELRASIITLPLFPLLSGCCLSEFNSIFNSSTHRTLVFRKAFSLLYCCILHLPNNTLHKYLFYDRLKENSEFEALNLSSYYLLYILRGFREISSVLLKKSWMPILWHLSCFQIFEATNSNIEKGQKWDLCRLDIGRNSSCFKMATPNCSILPNWM